MGCVEDPASQVKVGDKIMVEIIKIDERERKIRLSRRSLEEGSTKADLASFMQKQGSGKVHIGDLIQRAQEKGKGKEEGEEEAPVEEPPIPEAESAPKEEPPKEEPPKEVHGRFSRPSPHSNI